MSEREYRLWGYSPSHARLVLRAAADSGNPKNHDHLFTGVTYVSLPASLRGLRVRRGSTEEVALASEEGVEVPTEATLWVLEASPPQSSSPVATGRIVAIEHGSSTNDLPLFETQLDEGLPSARNAFEFEKEVLLAVAPLSPRGTARGKNDVDFWLTRADGRRVGVEVKWFSGRPTVGAIRSVVMRLVPAVSDDVAGLAVVFGGISDPLAVARFEDELRAHLLTALSASGVRFEIISADSRSPEDLRNALATLVG